MKKNHREEGRETKSRRLLLRRETIKALDDAALELVRGEGGTTNSMSPAMGTD